MTQKQYGDNRYYDLLEHLAELHSEKVQQYCGDRRPFDNFRIAQEIGVKPYQSAYLRLLDKRERLHTQMIALEKGEESIENIQETLEDLASYSLIMHILLSEEKQRLQSRTYATQNYTIDEESFREP